MKYGLWIGALVLAASTACAPPTLYQWGNYEGSLYQLMKDPTSLGKYGASLNEQILNAEAKGAVPPGVYAEYGYFLCATQKHSEAIAWFEKEKGKWPESAFLMDKMIITCRNPKYKLAESKSGVDAKPAAQADMGSVR